LASKRAYLQPKEMICNALADVMELQKGEELLSDPIFGKLHFRIEMYGSKWEFRFSVLEIDWNRCGVTLDVEVYEDEGDGDDDVEALRYVNNMIRREYALLDAMLLIGTPFETAYGDGDAM